MESTPAAPSPKIPASQGEAQKTVIHYIQQTVDALPPGTNVDGTRYAGTGSGMAYCEDEPKDDNSPVNYAYWGDLNLPPGADVNAMYGQVESIWKGWGWQVLERQGFEKPNRFGYAPDGYVVQIKAAYPPRLAADNHRDIALLPRQSPKGGGSHSDCDKPDLARKIKPVDAGVTASDPRSAGHHVLPPDIAVGN